MTYSDVAMSAAEPCRLLDNERLLLEASRFYWYHCVELVPGVVTDGDYDIGTVWSHYRFPDELAGRGVLDVGRGSGFFAFAFEELGANVVATDIGSLDDWDWVGGADARASRVGAKVLPNGFDEDQICGAFHFARLARSSKVEPKTINVYDLDPSRFDGRQFDLVLAGSIASHLRDPILAFERLRSVTRELCIVAAPSFDVPAAAEYPLMALVGTADHDRRSWWVANARGLVEAISCAGFSEVEIMSEFQLKNRRTGLAVDHLVAH